MTNRRWFIVNNQLFIPKNTEECADFLLKESPMCDGLITLDDEQMFVMFYCGGSQIKMPTREQFMEALSRTTFSQDFESYYILFSEELELDDVFMSDSEPLGMVSGGAFVNEI